MNAKFSHNHFLGILSTTAFFFMANACAPITTGQGPKASLSPRARAQAVGAKSGEKTEVTDDDPTTTPTSSSSNTPTPAASGLPTAATAKAAPAAQVTVAPKCRLTDSSKLSSDLSQEGLCNGIAVTASDSGAITLAGLTVQDNVASAIALTDNNLTPPKSDDAKIGRKTFTFVSDSTTPKTSDGKSNILQLGYLLPDPANQIDLDTLTVSLSTTGTTDPTVPQEKADYSNRDLPLIFTTAISSKNQATMNLLLGSSTAIPSISFVVTVSYIVKLPN
jgi:hypothetical protein